MNYVIRPIAVITGLLCFNLQAHLQDYIMRGRIQKHVALLKQCINTGKEIQVSHSAGSTSETIGTHELIRLCFKKIAFDSSPEPIFETWDIFKGTYFSIDTDIFFKEFPVLLYMLYQQCFARLSQSEAVHKVSLSDWSVLYYKIAIIPSDQLLGTLDSLYDGLSALMQEQGILTQSYSTWIRDELVTSPFVWVGLLTVACAFLK